MDVVRMSPELDSTTEPSQNFQNRLPKLTGKTIRGRRFNHFVSCSLTKIKGGTTIIGVEFNTLLNAVSDTANVAAFLLFPRLNTSHPSPSRAIRFLSS